MTWVKIDDNAPHHPKLRRVGPEAAWLWIAGLAHCNRFTTDGRIDALDLDALYPHADWGADKLRRLASKLVDVGLWAVTEGGWLVHDYAEFQGEALRSARDERRRWEAERKARQRANARSERAASAPQARPTQGEDTAPEDSKEQMSRWDRGGTGVGQSHGTGGGTSSWDTRGTPLSAVPPLPSRPVPSRPDQSTDGEGHFAPAADSAPASATGASTPSAVDQAAKAPRGPRSARKPVAPAEDTAPLTGTPARAIYDALLADPALRPIVAGPGDFAARVSDPATYPGVDVLAEIKRAGLYASERPGKYTDGRRYLTAWLARHAADVAARPSPAAPPQATTPSSRPRPPALLALDAVPPPTPEQAIARRAALRNAIATTTASGDTRDPR